MPIQSRDDMRCPTCGARQPWSDACRRCKCDLRLLRGAAAAFDGHRRHCLKLLNTGFPRPALRHALRCQHLDPGGESERLVAVCYLLSSQWSEALAAAETAPDEDGRATR